MRMAPPLVGALVLLISCAHSPAPPAERPFSSLVLRRLEGGTVKLEEFSGQVVLLDVWATWCEPCRYSMPYYRDLYRTLKDHGFVVLAVSVDESDATVRAFLDREPLPFPIMRDPVGEVPVALGATEMPTSFLLDRNGSVRWRHGGFTSGDAPIIRERVISLLEETPPSSQGARRTRAP
jgi:peroxiredoxin